MKSIVINSNDYDSKNFQMKFSDNGRGIKKKSIEIKFLSYYIQLLSKVQD